MVFHMCLANAVKKNFKNFKIKVMHSPFKEILIFTNVFFRRVVPVILEDSNEDLTGLDAALDDRTTHDWVLIYKIIYVYNYK